MLRNKVWRGQTGLKILHPFLTPYPTDWQERNWKCDAFHFKTTPICCSLMVAFDWTTAVCFLLSNKSRASNIQWNFGVSKIRVDIFYHMPCHWFGYHPITLCERIPGKTVRARGWCELGIHGLWIQAASSWGRKSSQFPWWQKTLKLLWLCIRIHFISITLSVFNSF